MIEEDAYELLHEYISRLEKNLHGQKGSKDIMEDIELRIAELCQLLMSDKKQVLEKEDIESVIKTLGNPEDFIEEENETQDSNKTFENAFEQESFTKEKRLYRDIENAKIAGICSGIANYFHVDVIVIRIIFLIFLFVGGFGFPLYIILWLVIPKTNSTIDRLRMQGKPITVDSVKEEIEQAAKRVKNSSTSFAERIRKDDSYTRRFSSIGRLISSVVGIGLIGTGLFFLIVFTILFFGGLRFIPIVAENGYLSLNQLSELLLSDSNDLIFVYLGVILVTFSLVLFLISNGTYILMKVKSKWTKISSLSLFALGIVGSIICIYLSFKTSRDFVTEREIEKEIASINCPELELEFMKETRANLDGFEIKNGHDHPFRHAIILKGNNLYSKDVEFIYRESKDSLYHVYQNFSANSYSYENALSKAKNIEHKIQLDSTKLLINPSFFYPKKDKIRVQRVKIIIEIPVNKYVKFGDEKISWDVYENEEIYW